MIPDRNIQLGKLLLFAKAALIFSKLLSESRRKWPVIVRQNVLRSKKRPSSAAAQKFMSKTWDLGCSRGVASCLLGTSWGNLLATNPCNRGRKIFNLISTSFCTFCPLGSAQSHKIQLVRPLKFLGCFAEF